MMFAGTQREVLLAPLDRIKSSPGNNNMASKEEEKTAWLSSSLIETVGHSHPVSSQPMTSTNYAQLGWEDLHDELEAKCMVFESVALATYSKR